MAGVSTFSQETADILCNRMIEGESLTQICKDPEMPAKPTILKWLRDIEGFSSQYARAREMQMEAMAHEILEIADDGSNDTYVDEKGNPRVDQDAINRSRLRVDTRKWLMSKLVPKKYGEKVTHAGDESAPLIVEHIGRRNAG